MSQIITVSDLVRYPLKSCKGTRLKQVFLTKRGLEYDRQWALFDGSGQVMTGRQYPSLLDLEVHIDADHAHILLHGEKMIRWPKLTPEKKHIDAKIFSNDVKGISISKGIDEWFSNYLGRECTLLGSHISIHRSVLEKHGGSKNNEIDFVDQAPILLISEESLADLNQRLSSPIAMNRFRPNIVVGGTSAYSEDRWQSVEIGGITFDVIQQCERCIFTTINPETKVKDINKEPLKTLASYRKKENGGVDFGVHLIPRSEGQIRLGDNIKIISHK